MRQYDPHPSVSPTFRRVRRGQCAFSIEGRSHNAQVITRRMSQRAPSRDLGLRTADRALRYVERWVDRGSQSGEERQRRHEQSTAQSDVVSNREPQTRPPAISPSRLSQAHKPSSNMKGLAFRRTKRRSRPSWSRRGRPDQPVFASGTSALGCLAASAAIARCPDQKRGICCVASRATAIVPSSQAMLLAAVVNSV